MEETACENQKKMLQPQSEASFLRHRSTKSYFLIYLLSRRSYTLTNVFSPNFPLSFCSRGCLSFGRRSGPGWLPTRVLIPNSDRTQTKEEASYAEGRLVVICQCQKIFSPPASLEGFRPFARVHYSNSDK